MLDPPDDKPDASQHPPSFLSEGARPWVGVALLVVFLVLAFTGALRSIWPLAAIIFLAGLALIMWNGKGS